MQLSRFTDYCLRVLMYLSFRDDDRVTVGNIATAYGISCSHLMKVVQHLAAAGYVQTVRGKGGGLRLARRPGLINLGEVVQECERELSIVECLGGKTSNCPLSPACVLRSALKEAMRSFFGTLERYTLEDLVANKSIGAPLFRGLAGSHDMKVDRGSDQAI